MSAAIILGALQIGMAIAQGIAGGVRRKEARANAINTAKTETAAIADNREFSKQQFDLGAQRNEESLGLQNRNMRFEQSQMNRSKNKAIGSLEMQQDQDRSNRLFGQDPNASGNPLAQYDPRNGRF